MVGSTLAGLTVRAVYLSRLFAGFRLLPHALRALAPTAPAIGLVVVLRLVESGERTALVAAGEVALYLAVTAGATLLFERRLVSEALGYLRGGPSPLRSAAA